MKMLTPLDSITGGCLAQKLCNVTTGIVGAHLCASQCKEVCEACRFLCKYILASIKYATISNHYQILGFSNTEIKAI